MVIPGRKIVGCVQPTSSKVLHFEEVYQCFYRLAMDLTDKIGQLKHPGLKRKVQSVAE
jgi:hypothetical protein